VIADDELDTATRLELIHDLHDFIKENRGKYKIKLYDGKGELEDIVAMVTPISID
jgi:hypothetical protein